MSLLFLKTIHVTCVTISYVLFFLRGVWLMRDSPMLQQRWVKTVPHITDTLLLTSAILLSIGIHQYPFVNSWLTAKVLGMISYIGIGMIAFRHGKTLRIKITAWLVAQLVFFYIVAVARTHNPLPFVS